MVTAWLFTFLAKGLGLGLASIAVVISGIAAVWTVVALQLGRSYERRAAIQRGDGLITKYSEADDGVS